MSNVRVLTGGLVVIVLALAGGTGYLIYERIQSEVGPTPIKEIQQDLEGIRQDQKETKQDVLELKDQVRLNTNDIATHRKAIAANKAEIGLLHESQDKLRKDMEAGDRQAKELYDHQQKQIDGLVTANKDLATRIEGLEKASSEINARLDAQGERIAEQEKRVEQLEQQDTKHDQEIAALKAEIAELKKLLGIDDTKKPSN